MTELLLGVVCFQGNKQTVQVLLDIKADQRNHNGCLLFFIGGFTLLNNRHICDNIIMIRCLLYMCMCIVCLFTDLRNDVP